MELIVNGKFLSQKVTGVQRYSLELLRELSKYQNLKITVAMPKNAEIPSGDFPNCSFIKTGKFTGNLWEQWSLPRFCKREKIPLLCMGNLAPFLYKSYVVIHDVTFKENFPFNDKAWSRKYSTFVRLFIYKCRKVFTDSKFSKSRIEHFYPKLKTEPVITYVGWEHMSQIVPEEVLNIPKDFYFSAGSVNGNKNFIYVLHLAKNNPDLNFVISGNLNHSYEEFLKSNNIKNCYFTGYVSNGQLVWLYKNCKGFILPSFYEGFGLPPLEAVAVGCRKLYLSDIPVFKELYGGCAQFFDPKDYVNTVDLKEDLSFDEDNFTKLLNTCSWENCAKTVYEGIFNAGK